MYLAIREPNFILFLDSRFRFSIGEIIASPHVPHMEALLMVVCFFAEPFCPQVVSVLIPVSLLIQNAAQVVPLLLQAPLMSIKD